MGKQLTKETRELTAKIIATPNRSEEKSNIILRSTFKIAQLAYYAGSLARYAGEALKQVLSPFHMALEHFLPMLSSALK